MTWRVLARRRSPSLKRVHNKSPLRSKGAEVVSLWWQRIGL
jgi:hypothetical protein